MKVSMIAAMARGRVIGTGNGGIPWDLERDRQHFRHYTVGKHMLLGRKTFEEMEGWFKTQTPLIMTRDGSYRPSLGQRVSGVEEAMNAVREAGADELVVSGGASVYHAALPHADELNLTFIDADIEGAAHFPDWTAEGNWSEISREEHPADAENSYPLAFVVLRHTD